MSRVVFVDLVNNFWDRHGIYSLVGCLKRIPVEVFYVKEPNSKKAIKKIKTLQPDLLLYSALSAYVRLYSEFDKIIKRYIKVKSMMGGPGPTFAWGLSKASTIDAFCIGEGEYALVEYIKGGCSGGKNIILNGEDAPSGFFNLADLDSLPFPERDLIYAEDRLLKAMSVRWFISGRGCPYQCSYCFNHVFRDIFKSSGPAVRKKSVDYLIQEIQETKMKYPFRNVVFNDDTLIIDKKWFLEFSERYPRTVGLPYACNIMPNLLDQEMAEALKNSGCTLAMFSVETADESLRKNILQRNVSQEQIWETKRLLDAVKIPVRIGSMIGSPGESLAQMLATLKLNIELKPTFANCSIFVPYPNLKLTEYAIANNYLSRGALGNLPRNCFTQTILKFSPEVKVKIQKLIYLFPVFTKFPFLFEHKLCLSLLFSLPRFVLLCIYECVNLYLQKKVYAGKLPFSIKIRMLFRYLNNRQHS